MALSPRVLSLKGVVQPYSWGGFEFIPRLLNIENPNSTPFAEYWLGAHPNHPSLAEGRPLSELVQNNAPGLLGKAVAEKYPSLPYLLKILDVRQMLSIQVHPDIPSAIVGFEKENEKGIPVNAANRNYKDQNHKPELMVALSAFWLLHGFKSEEAIHKTLHTVPELNFLSPFFEAGRYKSLYEQVMLMPQEEVNRILDPLVKRVLPAYKNNELKKDEEDFWAARAALNFCQDDNYDRGMFSIYLFNLVHLKRGEGIYQPAGMPHAYLEGQNVEIMANSDNVLRAGLTDKYIDVEELMKHIKFEATHPNVMDPVPENGHRVFSSPAQEFELHQYHWENEHRFTVQATTAEIFLLVDGELEANEMKLTKGEAILAFDGAAIEIKGSGRANLFRVTVPGTAKN